MAPFDSMSRAPWTRRIRGLLAAALLAAGAGALFQHHHVDHAGTLFHVEEDHGSHGGVSPQETERLPSPQQAGLPAPALLSAPPPDLGVLAGRGVPEPIHPVHAVGHDPPLAHGSRAPPASTSELHRAA